MPPEADTWAVAPEVGGTRREAKRASAANDLFMASRLRSPTVRRKGLTADLLENGVRLSITTRPALSLTVKFTRAPDPSIRPIISMIRRSRSARLRFPDPRRPLLSEPRSAFPLSPGGTTARCVE